MDYNNKTQLWQKPEDYSGLTKKIIANLALPLKNKGEQLYLLYDKKNKSQTMIRITYDEVNERTLIRTETTPDINPPKRLVKILEKHKFKKIV